MVIRIVHTENLHSYSNMRIYYMHHSPRPYCYDFGHQMNSLHSYGGKFTLSHQSLTGMKIQVLRLIITNLLSTLVFPKILNKSDRNLSFRKHSLILPAGVNGVSYK